MLIPHKGHTDTIQVYSVTVMTHVKALQAGHSSYRLIVYTGCVSWHVVGNVSNRSRSTIHHHQIPQDHCTPSSDTTGPLYTIIRYHKTTIHHQIPQDHCTPSDTTGPLYTSSDTTGPPYTIIRYHRTTVHHTPSSDTTGPPYTIIRYHRTTVHDHQIPQDHHTPSLYTT